MRQLIFCLLGPTCSGKTALALRFADALPVQIISVDSALIYRGMNIGTAKPDEETLARYPHALIDLIDPDQSYSVSEFLVDVKAAIEKAWSENKMPLLVGGTMMYFHALWQGLSALPGTDPAIRQKWIDLQKIKGTPYLHQQLAESDPILFERLKANDTQRVIRALEVFDSTGIPLSQWQQKKQTPLFDPSHFLNILLIPRDRAALHLTIKARFESMLAAGFLDEVQSLKEAYPGSEDLPSMRSVGYRQALGYLAGQYDRMVFEESAIAATRQLAKRQMTWLRAWPDGLCVDSQKPCFEYLMRIVEKHFLY